MDLSIAGPFSATIFTFLSAISIGALLFLPTFSSKLTGRGLVRIFLLLSLVSWLFGILALGLKSNFSNQTLFFCGGIAAFFIPLFIPTRDERASFEWPLTALLVVSLILFYFYQLHLLAAVTIYEQVGLFLTMLITGNITFAMILGHWYLVVPKLTVQPLLSCLRIMFPLLGLKFILSMHGLFENMAFYEQFSEVGPGYSFAWVMFLVRFGMGLIGLSVLGVFTWKLVKIRSTQSATGIFYVMVIFSFFSEIVSLYSFFAYRYLI